MANIKVKAIAKGFYGDSQKEIGDEFVIYPVTVKRRGDEGWKDVTIQPEEQFSEKWMEKIEEVEEVEPTVPAGDVIPPVDPDASTETTPGAEANGASTSEPAAGGNVDQSGDI